MLARHSRWLYGLLLTLLGGSVVATIWLLWLGGLSIVTSLIVDGAEYLLQHHTTPVSWLVGFAVISLLLQLLIVPSGSLLLIGAGFVFGVMWSVGIYTLMQCLAIWPVYRLCRHGRDGSPWAFQSKIDLWLEKSGVSRVTGTEPLVASMVLRLTPILPSAAASSVAAFSGISISVFFTATILVGWVRPLFFASIGGAVKELSGFATALSGELRLAPLIVVFVAVLMLLVVRLWLRRTVS